MLNKHKLYITPAIEREKGKVQCTTPPYISFHVVWFMYIGVVC